MAVPHRNIQRDKEPYEVNSLTYLNLVKVHVSNSSLEKAFDGEGLFHRKDCPDVKDRDLMNRNRLWIDDFLFEHLVMVVVQRIIYVIRRIVSSSTVIFWMR